jgi:hypothetical protein
MGRAGLCDGCVVVEARVPGPTFGISGAIVAKIADPNPRFSGTSLFEEGPDAEAYLDRRVVRAPRGTERVGAGHKIAPVNFFYSPLAQSHSLWYNKSTEDK